MKTKLTITISAEVLEEFKKICKKEGYKVSTKIERLVEEFVKKQGR